MRDRKLRIWIDLSNAPHVLFFEPIIHELKKRGHDVTVTARKFANTLALVRARQIHVQPIGAGYDVRRSEFLQQCYHFVRTLQLIVFARRRDFDVAASHQAHTQACAARRLGIPTFGASDYEHVELQAFRHARCFMVPRVIPATAFEKWGIPAQAIRPYEGIKEHVYLAGFRPAVDIRRQFGIAENQVLVTFRPVADSAHYGSGAGPEMQQRLLEILAAGKGVRVLVLPRTDRQRRKFQAMANGSSGLHVCAEAIDGPSLIFASDLVVSGGGTMLREAAVLGVPAWSCFGGPLGVVDSWLASEGKVVLLRSVEDLNRISIERRVQQPVPLADGAALAQIVQGICDTADCR